MELFTKTELLIMAIIVGILFIVVTSLTIVDIRDYFKNKKNKKNNVNIVEEFTDNVSSIPPVNSVVPILEDIEVLDFDEEQIVKDDFIEPVVDKPLEIDTISEKEAAKMELERVAKELEINENNDFLGDTVTNFELEQEKNAIISLDELLKLSDNLYDNNELKQYDDGNEPITIDEVINKVNNSTNLEQIEQHESVKKPIYEQKESIPFISSIYGLEKNSNELEFENTASYEKLEKEINRNNEFLDRLKEMHEKN